MDVECKHCRLEDLCKLLGYGEGEADIPAGTLKKGQHLIKGETIFRAGDPFRALFTIRSGAFKTLVSNETDSERVLGYHIPGELVGTEGMARESYTCTARALEKSKICEINLESLMESGVSKEAIQQAIIAILGKEIAFNHSVNASLIRQSSEQRLAAFLYCLYERMQSTGLSGAAFRLSMSRADISSYLGVAKETVSRILAKFQKQGIIDVDGKMFSLKDMEKLEELAEGK
jgi:CRP/FNR family transcriptional regulator